RSRKSSEDHLPKLRCSGKLRRLCRNYTSDRHSSINTVEDGSKSKPTHKKTDQWVTGAGDAVPDEPGLAADAGRDQHEEAGVAQAGPARAGAHDRYITSSIGRRRSEHRRDTSPLRCPARPRG